MQFLVAKIKLLGVLNTAVHWTVIHELQRSHYINFVIGPIFVHDSEIGPLWDFI